MNINTLHSISSFRFLLVLSFIFLLGFFLNGCDNTDKKSKKSFSIQQKVQIYTKETTLKGKVSNKKGAIHSGEIKVTDNKGNLIATTQLENSSHYTVKVPSGTELPLILSFSSDKENDGKDKLISVAVYTSIKKYDINELTTFIAKKAKELGGYTPTNMVMAAESTVGVPDTNKTTTGFRGDPTKQYGGWH